MDPRKREIDQLEGEIARLQKQMAQECLFVGKQIAGASPDETPSSELNKYLRSVQTLKKSEDDFRNDISHIRDTVRRINELAAAVADHERRERELAREREAKFVELGAGSFTIYKSLPDRDRFRSFFEEILKLDLEIERLQADLKSLDEEERRKGLFEKLRLKMRKLDLRSSINKCEKQKLKAYSDAGAKVADSEFVAKTSGDLRLLFDFATEKKRTIDALRQETQRLRDEIQAHKERLARAGINGDPDRRCTELEKRIADVRRELDVMHSWMGQFFIERDLRSVLNDPHLETKFEMVHSVRQQIVRKRGQIHRLKAELEIEELQREEKQHRHRRKQLEEELKVKERQLAVIDLEINSATRRIEELKRVITGEAPYSDTPALPISPDFYGSRPTPPPPSPPKAP